MLVVEEFPDRDLGVNYTIVLNNTAYRGVLPWDYTQYRYGWTEDRVDYYISNALARSATEKKLGREKFPSTPSTLYLKHWSDGDPYNMSEPPQISTTANVSWTQGFFNSSLMTKAEHNEFDSRCHDSDACSMDNITLRGYSAYPGEPLFKYKPSYKRNILRMFAVWVLVSLVAITVTFVQCGPPEMPRKQNMVPKPEKVISCHRLPPQIADLVLTSEDDIG